MKVTDVTITRFKYLSQTIRDTDGHAHAAPLDHATEAVQTLLTIETDEGLTGIGETDLNAWIARACIEAPGTHTMDRGLRPLVIGRDPTERVERAPREPRHTPQFLQRSTNVRPEPAPGNGDVFEDE